MTHVTFPKPLRGTATLARRQRRVDLVKHEQREMAAAKRRDRGCRWPGCTMVKKFRLALHACHSMQHRGMGGNPSGDRTRRDQLITFCAWHHGLFDRAFIDVQPRTGRGTDGPVDFYAMPPIDPFAISPKPNPLEIAFSETSIGVSVAVGA